ncbi:tyrosine--tRNA ligase [Candidatus Poribacteria bacterium]|nr:tyrosine--tRNA ligase [Candidatus Poribacteria bacterium]
MENALRILQKRGFIDQVSDEKLFELFIEKPVTCYIGFDPSATSLHVGNLFVMMSLAHIQRCGHHAIALIGGGTGMIGDPSGKSEERVLLSKEELEKNIAGVGAQIRNLLKPDNNSSGTITVLNNADWLSKYGFIEFLRDIGKHFRVSEMLAKESVKRRMEIGEGISFTEFSYMLLQSVDFLHLFTEYNCIAQFGGSDQWGNITAGIDLIRRIKGEQAYCATFPLITTASGQKLGKSEKGAIYLDPNLTSPYEFFQYWVNTDDRDVVKYLKWFTFLPLEEIDKLAEINEKEPEKREAHRILAYEVTKFVHGVEQAEMAVKTSQILFGQEISDMTDETLENIFKDVPSTEIKWDQLESGILIIDTLVKCGISQGRSAGRRLIEAGGVYLNNKRVSDINQMINKESLASTHIAVLRTGRKNYHLLKFVKD